MGWQPIETAPKGQPKSYGSGPEILGMSKGNGWTAYNLVLWQWHKDPTKGAWKSQRGVWTPTHWWDFGDGQTMPPPPTGDA